MTWYRGRQSGLALTALAVAAIGVTALACRQARVTAEAQPAPTGEGAPRGDAMALQAKCLSRMQYLATAVQMYVQDYDERYPPADKWCDVTYLGYVTGWELYRCPADAAAFSYAMNHKLSRVSESQITERMHTVCLYESSTGRKNECDQHGSPGDSVPVPPRHQGGNNYAFVDGHGKWLRPEAVPLDLYRLVKEEPHGAPPGDTKWAK